MASRAGSRRRGGRRGTDRDRQKPNSQQRSAEHLDDTVPDNGLDGHARRATAGVARRPTARRDLFSPAYPGALGRPAEEDDAGGSRTGPPGVRVAGPERDETPKGRD